MTEAYMSCRGCGARIPVPLEVALKASVYPEKYEVACSDCAKSLAEAYASAVTRGRIA